MDTAYFGASLRRFFASSTEAAEVGELTAQKACRVGSLTSARVAKHFTDKDEPIFCVLDSFICKEQFKKELFQVINEKTSETLAGYVVRVKSQQDLFRAVPLALVKSPDIHFHY